MHTKRPSGKRIVIDSNACKGCRLCIDQCPKNVLEISPERSSKGYLMPVATRIEDCISCLVCDMICPDLAITIEGVEDEK